MSKFKKDNSKETPKISTASLPDIVFMLLFFFMTSTKMKDAELKVKVATPTATEVVKLEDKTLTSFIYVGVPNPRFEELYGTSPRIQLNDAIIKDVKEIPAWIEMRRAAQPEYNRGKIVVSVKADRDVKMGIITDVKQQLREANALKLNYSTHQGQIDYNGR
ncbi:MAG: biopolymer transporter ExbD [Bacteroidetes bacterium]|nr:biopolymer transporter ExbD [Bacteroidota bacterium]